ncbi:MAG: preprotein translocase subunit YajC [Proteobacteria bacterium]|nr:preprotein translocase subunit YajC [Pseudomonadota bacterium]
MFIQNAMAETGSALGMSGNSPVGTMLMLGAFIAIFYFMSYRPQAELAKKKKELMSNLKKNDIVVCSSGIIGKITKVHSDQIVLVEISDNVIVRMERDKIAEIVDKKYYIKLK